MLITDQILHLPHVQAARLKSETAVYFAKTNIINLTFTVFANKNETQVATHQVIPAPREE